MILPSDSDLPADDPGSGSGVPAPVPWWAHPGGGPQDPAGEGTEDGEGDEEESDADGPLPPELQSVAGPGWRAELCRDLIESLRDLQAIEDPDDEFSPPEPPDLFTFFGELAALRHELRHQGQRTHDIFHQLDKSLKPLLKSQAAGKGGGAKDPSAAAPDGVWTVETCLALISVWDLLPKAASAHAFKASFQPLFESAGLTRIPTEGLVFDPAAMTMSGTGKAPKKSHGRVLRETAAGFLRNGVLLRPAAVVVGGA